MAELPRLSRSLLATLAATGRRDIELPPDARGPERVVQFGTGAFVRGFVEYFVDNANRRGAFDGSVVAVSSTMSARHSAINEQDGLFTLCTRGLADGRPPYRIVGSLSRAIAARERWNDVLALARRPEVEIVVSHTTEVGIAPDAAARV